MTAIIRGVKITLTPEQIAQIELGEKANKKPNSSIDKVLKHFGFKSKKVKYSCREGSYLFYELTNDDLYFAFLADGELTMHTPTSSPWGNVYSYANELYNFLSSQSFIV